jgi:hypothetical protein
MLTSIATVLHHTRSQQYDIDENMFQWERKFTITDDDCIYLSVIEQGSGGVHV